MRQNEELSDLLASCLEPSSLERALLALMVEKCPGATALASVGKPNARPATFRDGQRIQAWHAPDTMPPFWAVPIHEGGDVLGWIAYAGLPRRWLVREAAVGHLRRLAAAAAIPARNARRFAQTLDLALRDPLTSLLNRRGFDTFLEREGHRAIRHDRSLAVLVIDLDQFKNINDFFGHAAGDRALVTVATVLKESARRTDVMARIGGDEFAVLLPDTTAENAMILGRRFLRALSAQRVVVGGGRRMLMIAASAGAADLSQAADAGQHAGECTGERAAARMVELADERMLRAKHAGRAPFGERSETTPVSRDARPTRDHS
ncbi:MAG: GGDEF domain-containing protein [Acidobacteriota bacterium]|nr:MAG: GGDEF domain-containing protein [Acidobacteriota bacterium]